MWHDEHEWCFLSHSSSFSSYDCRKHDKQRQDLSTSDDRDSQVVWKKKYHWWKEFLSDRFMKIKKQMNIYAHCSLETMTLRQIQHFNSSQIKVMKYTHALFNDVKLIIKSAVINKITIVLKFVMLFYLKITNAINHINHFRVLICTLNNATINNLIERFNQKLQTQKKI